jgi:hypothetical protein
MSFVTWDYKCHNCGKVEELTVRRSEQDRLDRRRPSASLAGTSHPRGVSDGHGLAEGVLRAQGVLEAEG